jgi:LPXTG-site transpeptidase (sortase) family protein
MNPLFPDEPDKASGAPAPGAHDYLLPRSDPRRIERPGESRDRSANPAVDLIRRKIDNLYQDEPSARMEAREAEAAPAPRSKHQQFMHELSSSGKSLAEIQTAWHQYYASLPDYEKHAVWQEFYAANNRQPSAYTQYTQAEQAAPRPRPILTEHPRTRPQVTVAEQQPILVHAKENRKLAAIKKHVRKKVAQRVRIQSQSALKAKQHAQSLLFGLGLGALVLVVFLFGLFNEMIIAPFIQPGSHAQATPIILNENSVAPTSTPEVIVPKINVEIPVIYNNQSVNEEDIQDSLQEGVFHYPTTSLPGQQGNAAYFGHSSNNIFNKGKYKFAFVLLHELEPGDIFYLTKDSKVYTYKVFAKKIVNPSDTWVLNPVEGKASTATLITCDPPGTSLHRLVVWGEQISPDPAGNPTATVPSAQPKQLTGNGPTLLGRFWHWATPW